MAQTLYKVKSKELKVSYLFDSLSKYEAFFTHLELGATTYVQAGLNPGFLFINVLIKQQFQVYV